MEQQKLPTMKHMLQLIKKVDQRLIESQKQRANLKVVLSEMKIAKDKKVVMDFIEERKKDDKELKKYKATFLKMVEKIKKK